VTSRQGRGRYVTLSGGVDPRVDVIMTSSGSRVLESRLVVADVRPSDAGLYVCSVSSADGHIASARAYLTVNAGAS